MQTTPFCSFLMTLSISISMPLLLLADSAPSPKKKGHIQQIKEAHSSKPSTTTLLEEEDSSKSLVTSDSETITSNDAEIDSSKQTKLLQKILDESSPSDKQTTVSNITAEHSEDHDMTLSTDDSEDGDATMTTTDDFVESDATFASEEETMSSSSPTDEMQASACCTKLGTFQPSCCTCCYVRPECHVLPEAGRAWWVGAEFLYWRASGPSLDFAVSNNNLNLLKADTGAEPQNGLRSNLHKANYSWDPGFRVTVGSFLPHDCWEIFADYTWYQTKQSKTVYLPPANGVQATTYPVEQLVSTIADDTATFAANVLIGHTSNSEITSNLRLHYQVADLLLARLFSLSNYLDLKLTAGLQGAWISQKWNAVNYHIRPVAGVFPSVTNTMNWSYEGGGLQIGANANLYLCQSLHLYLNGAFSMLYGQHRTHLQTEETPIYFFNAPINNFTSKDMRVVTQSQLGIGLSWTYEFACSMRTLDIFAGYELHLWTNLHEVYRNTENLFMAPHDTFIFINSPVFRTVDTGPIAIQGINVGATLSF